MRIGTSGWHYAHWRGPFYPPDLKPGEMLDWYARRFDCVELNNSFYKLPTAGAFAAWHDAVPEQFAFAVKGSRYITHVKRLREPAEPIGRLTEAIAGLGKKLGPVLFQLPPTMKCDAARLTAFLDAWPPALASAWEFRDASWFRDEVFDVLASHGASLCLYELKGRRAPEVLTAALVYVRLHGPGAAYQGSYADDALDDWAKRLAGWEAEGHDPWCFFDNDQRGYAAGDALRLRERVAALG